MRTFYSTSVLLFLTLTLAYSQEGSIWIRITPKKSTRDLGFDTFAKAAIYTSNRIQSNHLEIQNVINQTLEVYEEKIYKGCGSDFGDYFYNKLTNTINELNRNGINYTLAAISSIKYTFNSLQREMIHYDCSKSNINTSDSYSKAGNYSDKSSGFPKSATILKTTTLWDSCDWTVMKSLGKLSAGDYVTVHSICETSIKKNLCFVTLSSGKSAFVYAADIEF